MYAVIEMQGTQILVEKGQNITVNRMGEAVDSRIKCEKVLFGKKGASYLVGEPYIKNAYVELEITRAGRAKKVVTFKYRDRKSSQSKKGHRQNISMLNVKDIHLPGGEGKDEEKKAKEGKSNTKAVKKDTAKTKETKQIMEEIGKTE